MNKDPFSGEVPVMVDSARKELECPICMEVMMPPARIWQCKVGSVMMVALMVALMMVFYIVSQPGGPCDM